MTWSVLDGVWATPGSAQELLPYYHSVLRGHSWYGLDDHVVSRIEPGFSFVGFYFGATAGFALGFFPLHSGIISSGIRGSSLG